MKGNIMGRLFRLETATPSEEDNREFRARLDRARARLIAEGYDVDKEPDALAISRREKLLSIFAKSRNSSGRHRYN